MEGEAPTTFHNARTHPMTRLLPLLAAGLLLSGCAGVGDFLTRQQGDDTIGAKVLADIQGCSRSYTGAIAPTAIQGSFTINCDPIVKDGSHLERAAGSR